MPDQPEIIPVPRPKVTDVTRVGFATAAAFRALIAEATAQGLNLQPTNDVVYLPNQGVAFQFQQACRAVLAVLLVKEGPA